MCNEVILQLINSDNEEDDFWVTSGFSAQEEDEGTGNINDFSDRLLYFYVFNQLCYRHCSEKKVFM